MRILIIILLVCFKFTGLYSQNISFEKITTRAGLSQNDVNCVFQDSNGFLWIGTNDGLNRYDGYSFKTYRIDRVGNINEGLSSNLIFRIKEDLKGNLWIATSNEGVCKFEVKKEIFTPYRNTPENPNLLSDNRVLDLECLADGSIWVATMKGISIINEVNGEVNIKSLISDKNPEIPQNIYYCVTADKYNRVWFGSTSELIMSSVENGVQKYITVKELSNYGIRILLPIDQGIFVGTSLGVYFIKFNKVNIEKYSIEKISDINTRDIIYTKSNELIFATNQGLYIHTSDIYNKFIFKLKAHIRIGSSEQNLNSEVLNCLYEDNSGIIWIGTNGGGLNKYNPQRKKFNHYRKTSQQGALSHNKIRAIYEDSQKNIWFGTEGGGINFLSHKKNRDFNTGFVSYSFGNQVIEDNVYSLLETKFNGTNSIWAGAGYPVRLTQFVCRDQSYPQIDKNPVPELINSVFVMLEDSEKSIWLGTYGSSGLFRYTQKNNSYTLKNYVAGNKTGNISSNIIRSLLQDKKGNIWIGTDAGLNLLPKSEINKDEPVFRIFRNDPLNPKSISNDYILPIFESKNGDLWVGTMGGGLNKIEFSENFDSITFRRYDSNTGLPNDVIKGILEDDYGVLWVSSNKGLSRFDPSDNSFSNFDISDGLQDFEFGELACCKLDDGLMIFGGVNGFNTFYPNQITTDKSIPKVVFTELQILNQTVKVGEKINNRIVLNKVINHAESIKLKYSENSFAIYFSGLHFSAPSKNMYKYMLEGFDQDWIKKNSGERFAKYTNLKPGKYTFKLLASNNDGVWSDMAKEIEIIVVPPWWRSIIAIIIYFILFVLMMWFFQRYSIIRIKQKNELLMEHFEKEKLEELSQMKLRFFTNISHEFRTPLTLILGSIDKIIKQGDVLSSDLQSKHFVIKRNASILLRLINQLVDFRKFEQGKMKLDISNENIISLLDNIHKSFGELANRKNIKFNLSCPSEELYVWFDQDKVEKIIYNLLSNAFKATPNNGIINILVEEFEDVVKIIVEDNGIGMSEEVKAHIFERFYMATKIRQYDTSGTGIGLSFSKGLAELHKGDIRFSSEEGQGSRFELILKKGNLHFDKAEIKTECKEVSQIQSYELPYEETLSEDELDSNENAKSNKKTILIVEDNIELRNFISEGFKSAFNIVKADNGEQGVLFAFEYNPDLIISDIKMPLKDGFELCKEIKNDEQLSHIPVILLTAKTSTEDTIKGFETGADAYIPKPFDFGVLSAQVNSLIQTREKLKRKLKKSIEVIPSEVTTTSIDEKFLCKMLKIIEEHISDFDFTVERLADIYGMSQINMNKKLKSLTDQTTNVFIRNIRLKRAAQLLKTGRYSVADVTYEVGFADLKYFRSCFKKEFECSPSDYIRQHKS